MAAQSRIMSRGRAKLTTPRVVGEGSRGVVVASGREGLVVEVGGLGLVIIVVDVIMLLLLSFLFVLVPS